LIDLKNINGGIRILPPRLKKINLFFEEVFLFLVVIFYLPVIASRLMLPDI
jgi:hypothetical protein